MDKTREERIEELLNQTSMEAVTSIKGPSLSDQLQQTVEDEEPVEEEETPSGGRKIRIPASRLKTLTSKVEELEARLTASRAMEERLEALEAQKQSASEDELPDWWVEAYGDNDVSRKGYGNQQRVMREELKRTLAQQDTDRKALEQEDRDRKSAIEDRFDTQMNELQESLGRDLTDNQKGELMDIVGEYSPMEDGKYTAYMSLEKAHGIWQKGQGNAGKHEMARIAGTQSQGSSNTVSLERPQWGDWRKKYTELA